MPRVVALTAGLVTLLVAGEAAAQQPMDGRVAWEVTPTLEQWSFGDGARDIVRSARLMSLPVVAVIPVGGSLTLDAWTSWSVGEATVLDENGDEQTYELRGMSDVKVRGTWRVRGDGVLLTMGVGLPTGRTSLDIEEYAALRVLAAPGLRLGAPAVGTGLSATSGVVITHRRGGVAWGFGASYEYRGSYAPLEAAAAGLTTLDLDPGDAVRLSVGADGVLGASTMSVMATATFSGSDRLTTDMGESAIRFGPSLGVEWQLRTVLPGFSQVTVYAWDRYRMAYEDGSGEPVPGSSGNEVEVGARGTIPLARTVMLVTGLDARHHTGLRVNDALSTAAMVGGGATLGLSISTARLTFQPFVRAQAGRMQSGDSRFGITGVAGGLTIGSPM